MNLFGVMTVFADEPPGGQSSPASFLTMGIYLVAMIAVFYFLLIRPQKKRDKEARQMMESLAVGDKVVTIGGIYGKITQLKEDAVIIETGAINEKSTMKLSRSAIKEILTVKE